jgi:predicted metalloendopeptidase
LSHGFTFWNVLGCINTAALILQNLNQSVDPCEDFYQFACGGFVERTDIPNDRTRMSTFSVLGDELLTQVSVVEL